MKKLLPVISIVLALVAIGLAVYPYFTQQTTVKGNDVTFAINNFSIDYELLSYGEQYDGEGIITASDNGNYFVIVKILLKSGGSKNNNQEIRKSILVIDGIGRITTHAFAMEDEGMDKPVYEFEIIGYTKIEKYIE